MSAVSAAPPPGVTPPATGPATKMVHAAQQFESILLNSLLGSLQHSFSLIGEKAGSAASNYDYLGMQALASTLAARGGIGIANRIVASLRQHEHSIHQTAPR